jgi:hypothetical protein
MGPVRPSSPCAERSFHAARAILLASTLSAVGCGGLSGGPPPKTEAQLGNETKVQALLKEGKSLAEVRAIMRGEPVPHSKKGKKSGRKH